MSVRTTRGDGRLRLAPTGAAGTLHGPAVDAKPHLLAPARVPTGTYASGSEKNPFRAANAPAMSWMLADTAVYTGSLADAFSATPVQNAKGKMRHQLVGRGWHVPWSMYDVKKWVKIGGKNGMAPMDVAVLLGSAYYMEAKEQTDKLFDGQRVGFVFDGDNFEPDTTPFSVLIYELIDAGHVVVAVKEDQEVSTGFYNGWIELAKRKPNFLFACVPGIKKEQLTELADGFVYYGTTYKGTKDYRFRPDGSSTQGYSEVEALYARNSGGMRRLRFLRDGSNGHPLVVVAKESASGMFA